VGLVFTAVYRLFENGYLDAQVRTGGSLSRDPWWVVIVATSFVGGEHFRLLPPLAILLGASMGLIWYGVVQPTLPTMFSPFDKVLSQFKLLVDPW